MSKKRGLVLIVFGFVLAFAFLVSAVFYDFKFVGGFNGWERVEL